MIDAERLVFPAGSSLASLDETHIKTDFARLYGWGFEGERVVDKVPGGHWHTSTLVAAITCEGVLAAMVTDGPMNGLVFEGFCREYLAPALLERGEEVHNPLVVLDNLSSHHLNSACEIVESAGSEFCFLPAYSPDLNPIENAFSKIKSVIRKLRPRNWDSIIDATATALRSITPCDCVGFIENAAYEFP